MGIIFEDKTARMLKTLLNLVCCGSVGLYTKALWEGDLASCFQTDSGLLVPHEGPGTA
jgi:hypothetical protein